MCLLVSMFISTVGVTGTLKVIQALPGMPKPVTEAEVNNLLQSKLNIQIATLDEDGYPVIQPTWFLYDNDSGKIYTYKGVKGRAGARISEDIQKNLSIVEKINLKYLGTLEHPLAKRLMENTRNGIEVIIEITPKFFSAWDFGKAE